MKRIVFVLSSILVLTISGFGQSFPGYNSENYSGVNGVFFNPANVVDSRYRWNVNLFSLNTTVANDYASIKTADLFKSNDSSNVLQRKANGNANVFGDIDIHGPSVMFKINSKSSLALTTRGRFMFNVDNVPSDLLTTVGDDSSGINFPDTIHANRFGMTAHMWAEFGITYGRILMKDEKHTFRGGITLKYLAGVGSAYFSINNFSSIIDNHNDPNNNYNIRTQLPAQIAYGVGGLTDLNNIKLQINGSGVGADIGFSYEYRPNGDDDNKGSSHYKIKASIALLDLGAINYTSNKNYTGSYTLNTAAGNPPPGQDTLLLTRFNSVQNINDFNNAIKGAAPKIVQNDSIGSYTMSLPTSLTGAVDYNVYGKLYLGLGGLVSLNHGSSKIEKTYAVNYITLSPRYEKRLFAIAAPLTINQLSGFNAGVSMRLGPVFLGSGSILSTLISGKTKQADFHFGISFGVSRKHKKNKSAPEVQEGVKTAAVPLDTDGDGIPDSIDKCPTVAGVLKYNGCPIPDADSDNVNDEEDSCPHVPGLIRYHGCPIPDADSDGVNDEVDSCPHIPGLAKYNGCPIPDSDGDGVNDELDSCPHIPGSVKYHGCPIPDSDSDGVNDEEDKCPTVPGTISNHGCPVIQKAVIQKMNFAAKRLSFQTGKAVILPVSYPQLNKVAQILKSDSSLNLTIAGYTDNKGDSLKNLKLSAGRANAAKAYLIKKGVPERRLTAEGFGSDKPIAPNNTPKGRAMNRRVEFYLKNY